MPEPVNPFVKAAAELVRQLMTDRERYLEAWVAETGLLPSECVLEERILQPVDGMLVRRELVVKSRAKDPFMAGWDAAMKNMRDRVTTAERGEQNAHGTAKTAHAHLLQAIGRLKEAAAWLEPSAKLYDLLAARETEGKPEEGGD